MNITSLGLSNVCISCRANTLLYYFKSFLFFTFLSAIRRAERGTVLDEPPVDPLLVVETSITRTYYPRLVTFCSYGAVYTSYCDGVITARTQLATGVRPYSPEVITESPSHRGRSPGLNMELIDREATNLFN